MDNKYITRCFDLAKKGIGKVSPNPLVGCVIVKDGKIIGEGWHEEYGGAHAEKNAIKNSTESVKDSTLYCNLEPCSHTNKQTPPCTPEIIKNDISKVVISNIDTNPDVNGKGIEQLREAGIDVVTGIEEQQGLELNKFYFKNVEKKTPFVTLKIAQTLDGKISEIEGKQSWITGKEAGEFVHRQRGLFDAVLVGVNSVIVDDPMLTVRHSKGRDPVRIILDGNLSIPESAKIINTEEPNKTWIITSNDSNIDKKNRLIQKGVRIIEFPLNGKGDIDLKELLKQFGNNNVSSILVEGGSRVFSQFIDQELFDELVILQSPKFFGKGLDSVTLGKPLDLKMKSVEKLGDDLKIIYGKTERAMFTGLVEETGIIKRIKQIAGGINLTIQTSKIMDDLKIGDSVSVNGVCLTAVNISSNEFSVDAVGETLKKTTIQSIRENEEVNLERSVRLMDRLGGHLVQGHVNGIGTITQINKLGDNYFVEVLVPDHLKKYLIDEGSIAIDGISLTIAKLNNSTVGLSVIPHTWSKTILKNKKVGAKVNIETDVIAKYVEKLLSKENGDGKFTENWFKQLGY